MSINITNDSISNLLEGRILVNTYQEDILNCNDNNLIKKYKIDLQFNMAKLGYRYSFSIDLDKVLMNFPFINEAFNVVEFDRCYRIRHINKPWINEKPIMEYDDFCIEGSGCIKRGICPCINPNNEEFVKCYYTEPAIVEFLTTNESQICIEMYEEAEKLNIDKTKLIVPHPMSLIAHCNLNPDKLTPIYCEGVATKIEEPRFNVFWGMERFIKLAEIQWDYRKRIFEDANTNM